MARTKPSSGVAPATTFTFCLLNAIFVTAAGMVAAATLYPVYESTRYVASAALAIGGGIAIAVLADRRQFSGAMVALLGVALYVVGGIAVVIPGATSGIDSGLSAALQLLRGPVLGWKDIVTLPLPLGEYRATIVPVYALLLVGTLLASWWAMRSQRRWGFAAGVVVAVQVVAIAVGPASRAQGAWGASVGTYLNREFVEGLALFLMVMLWFGWRAWYARRRAIVLTRGRSGVRLARAPRYRIAAEAGAGMVMLVIAIVIGAAVAGPLASATPREVARSAVEPQLAIDAAVSPLASLRMNYSDAEFDSLLFSVSVESGNAQRVRIASLPYYDGNSYSATAPEDTEPARFQRVPSALAPAKGAEPVSARVTIGEGGGVWVPLVGELGSVTFGGPRRTQLVDAFYYLAEADTGVMALDSGVTAGDAYEVSGYVRPELTVAEIGDAPGNPSVPDSLIPDSLRSWVDAQETTQDGEGLAELVRRLRARGYLSHALEVPSPGAKWVTGLGEYTFAAAAAGHSYDRIDRLFTELNERAEEVGAGATDEQLVAAAGDDEQFATATSLIAATLGFPSRVVLGAHLESDDVQAIAPCQNGQCRGQNITAWVEVQAANGTWVPIDVTPQHVSPIAPDVTAERDPEYPTPLDPDEADAIVPPSAQRGGSDEATPPEVESPQVTQWWGRAAAISTLSFLVALLLLGPVLGIILWKAVRRRRRRRKPAHEAVENGWDEYLDLTRDAGRAPMLHATRMEIAASYGTPHGIALATMADRATFSGRASAQEDASQFWELVNEDRRYLLTTRGWWHRWGMRLSLRSLWRGTSAPQRATVAPSRGERAHWRSDHTGGTGNRRNRTRTAPRRGRKDGT